MEFIEVLKYYREIDNKRAKTLSKTSRDFYNCLERLRSIECMIYVFEENEVIYLPLRDNTEFYVPHTLIYEYGEIYPKLNIKGELKRMQEWFIRKPFKKKHRDDIYKYIKSWMYYANKDLMKVHNR